MRSLLTSLGIIIGVGSVIIMVALGEGTQRSIEESMTAMGTNILQISYRRPVSRSGQAVFTRASSFSKNDLEKLRTESTFIKAISGYVSTSANVYGNEGNAQVQVQGVEPDYAVARNWNLSSGYFFDDEDLYNRSTVAVLGQTTAETLFGDTENALFERIRIGTNYYTVIGILESKGGGLIGGNMDDVVMVPLDTAMTRLNNTRNINSIFISVVGKEYMDAAQKETELILRESRNISDGISSDFVISNQADMISMASEITRTLTMLLAAIAGVSLLVGGIGIMNIMLVSVTERTREIGIRMAVGGRKRDILFQFLAESAILSLMGGLLGIGMAFLVCRLASMYGVPAYINPLIVAISTLFAAFIGIIFGYYPALKAARLYPIDALRYE
jgi:putative ABC transport system permease protein